MLRPLSAPCWAHSRVCLRIRRLGTDQATPQSRPRRIRMLGNHQRCNNCKASWANNQLPNLKARKKRYHPVPWRNNCCRKATPCSRADCSSWRSRGPSRWPSPLTMWCSQRSCELRPATQTMAPNRPCSRTNSHSRKHPQPEVS